MKADELSSQEVAEIRTIFMPTKMQDAIVRHMMDAGLGSDPDWVEIIEEWPVEKIVGIKGIGPAMMNTFANRCQGKKYHRIWEEWQSCRDNPKAYVSVDGRRVRMDEIKKARTMKEVMAKFGYLVDYGESYGTSYREIRERFDAEVSDKEVARAILEHYDSKRKTAQEEEQVKAEERPVAPVVTDTSISGWTARHLKKLSADYNIEDAPINDKLQVQHLAELMAARTFHDLKARDLMGLTSGNFSGELAKEYEWLRKQISDLDIQISRIQKDLSMTPDGRAKVQGARENWRVITDLVEATQELRATVFSTIMDGEMMLGVINWHFPTPEYMPRCAHCGGQKFVAKSPNGNTVDVPMATEAAMAGYAQASDFIPDDTQGAPEHIFDPIKKA